MNPVKNHEALHSSPTPVSFLTFPSAAPRFDPELVKFVRNFISRTGLSSKCNDPELCRKCQAMFSARGFFHLFNDERYLGNGRGFRHSRIMSFQARNKCRFCRFIWNEECSGASSLVFELPRLRDLANSAKCRQPKQTWVFFRARTSQERTFRARTFLAKTAAEAVWWGLTILVESTKGEVLWEHFDDLRPTVAEGSILSSFIRYRPLDWAGLDDKSGLALRKLLQDCELQHSRCQPSGSRPLPTRLLRLAKNGQSVQLHLSLPGQGGRYAALSYCWGGPQANRLLRSNLQSLCVNPIDCIRLPNTLQDAIAVCRSLHLKYLWVDALCIIQDDEADKAREISRMCSIYENSYVTVVAATAPSVNDGFLKPAVRTNKTYPSCPIHLTLHHGGKGMEYALTFTPKHTHRTGDFAINKRGWTYQESFIPPRLLVFGDHEPFLRCRTVDFAPTAQTAIDYWDRDIVPRRDLRSSIEGHHPDEFRSVWRRIVEDYSKRQFSFEEDRPLALKGMEDFLEKRANGKCYFGMWSSMGVGCLLWTAEPQQQQNSPRSAGLPTWSWLSTPNQVSRVFPETWEKHPSDAVVEFSECQPSRLTVECPVISYDEIEDGDICDRWDDVEGTAMNQRYGEVQMYILPLSKMSYGTVVALRTARLRDLTYVRLGVIELWDAKKWFSKPKEKITLV